MFILYIQIMIPFKTTLHGYVIFLQHWSHNSINYQHYDTSGTDSPLRQYVYFLDLFVIKLIQEPS
jgi:hypothetical protein